MHAALFVTAHHYADSIVEGPAGTRDERRRVEREYHRALVVADTAPDQPAIFLSQNIGVGAPALALGNDVDVGDNAYVFFMLSRKVGPAHITVAVVDRETEAFGNRHGGIEGVSRTAAKGSTLFRRSLYAALRYQLGHIV